MADFRLTRVPIATTAMLIRRPVADVFDAFVKPEITTRFWFTNGSGPLEAGKRVQWDWEMYDISIPVTVRAIEPNKRIVIEWPGEKGQTTVEWMFEPHGTDATFVTIVDSGFTGNGDELVQQATGSTQGFTLVLAGAKAWLEHGIQLNLVADRYPAGLADD